MKINRKLTALLLGLSLSTTACSNVKEPEKEQIEVTKENDEKINTELNLPDNIEMVENKRSINDAKEYKCLRVNSKVNVRVEKNTDCEILDTLPIGFEITEYQLEDDWYKINYQNTTAYIYSLYANEITEYEFPYEFKKVIYLLDDLKLYNDEELNIEEGNLSKLECCEVYEEYDDSYLIKTNDYVGYISKNQISELTGIFVVIDISDQELKLYKDNELILTSPVVTGKPSTPTNEGLFEIYNITHNRYLIGKGYKSYVDIMMKFDGNIGLHDAEYHTDDNGFKHGWRNRSDFGGETYIKNGSHGCVNMPHEEVMEVSEYVDLGTKVLVKK